MSAAAVATPCVDLSSIGDGPTPDGFYDAVAEASGISRNMAYRILGRRDRTPSLKTAQAMASYLGITVDELLNLLSQPQ